MTMNVLDPEFLGELSAFLKKAMRATYAGNGAPVSDPDVQRPGFKEFVYGDGEWRYRDSYTGFLTSAGQEVVWYNDIPVWTQSYAGGMLPDYRKSELAKRCFAFLKDALVHGDKTIRFQARGPRVFQHDEWRYQCKYGESGLVDFHGREEVSHDGRPVFFHHFFGGVIIHQEQS
ncbi:hypothetical protein HZA87_05295 [Candidatus Uhrbacteria bacterium]|nr:hypothetical protein [Candidatus Uhrbacteria bacterium]